jgi:hypothetical protein
VAGAVIGQQLRGRDRCHLARFFKLQREAAAGCSGKIADEVVCAEIVGCLRLVGWRDRMGRRR